MVAFLSLMGLLLFFAIGVISIYFLIDFIEYLKKYHSARWEQLSFARLFGLSQERMFSFIKFIP